MNLNRPRPSRITVPPEHLAFAPLGDAPARHVAKYIADIELGEHAAWVMRIQNDGQHPALRRAAHVEPVDGREFLAMELYCMVRNAEVLR